MQDKVLQPAVTFHRHSISAQSFAQEVIAGLSSSPRTLPPKYFYDQRGSLLFDEICRQPEYYITRVEMDLLSRCLHEIRAAVPAHSVFVELGSGASTKVRLLLDALSVRRYVAIDIDPTFLLQSTQALAHEHFNVDVHAVYADFSQKFPPLPLDDFPVIAFYPGSSIGNFEPAGAVQLLRNIATFAGSGGQILIGRDCSTDRHQLEAAYNDKAGITAKFNLNMLERMRRDLGADIAEDAFAHHAFFNAPQNRIEMHLVAQSHCTFGVAGHQFTFQAGETIHTENSYKYPDRVFHSIVQQSGWHEVMAWTDSTQRFTLQLLST